MEEKKEKEKPQNSNDKQHDKRKHRRNSAKKLLAEQKNYTFSEEDLLLLDQWEKTLKNQRTRSTYIGAILLVCDFYRKPIHEIEPQEWVSYVNKTMPDQIVKREISVSTSRIRYYAIIGFLDFYSMRYPDYADLEEDFLNPAHAPTPKVNKYPTAAQMATILQAMKKADLQVYIAALLAYECALAPSEIIELQTDSFIRNEETDTCMLSVPGKAKRLIVIREDLMEEIEHFFSVGGYYGDDWLLHNKYGGQMRASVLQRACRKAQQAAIDSGAILEPYSLISIRSAAIHRFLMSDGAKGTSTAQYTGISEAYAFQMQSVGLSSAVQLPGTKRGYTISDLLDPENGELQENEMTAQKSKKDANAQKMRKKKHIKTEKRSMEDGAE